MGNYTVTHCHSSLSLLDSCTDYKDYIDKCVELGQNSIAITEHGNVYNWVAKKLYCKEKGVKYLHGCEVYLTENPVEKVRDNYHTILIAKNYEGAKELNRLVSMSWDDNHFYYKPRISFDEFLNISDNIISTSACLASPLSKLPLDNDYYDKLSSQIDNLDNTGEYKYIFDFYKKLCDVLKLKSALGVRTRREYQNRSLGALKEICEDYTLLLERIEDFYKVFQSLWFWENKPHGFDVQDIRIGGLVRRIQSGRQRLIDFIDGKISLIPELEEKALDMGNWWPYWGRLATPNRLSHKF